VLTITACDDRRMLRQGRPGHPRRAEDVDLEDPPPLVVGIAFDGAGRPDPRVVDEDVQPAEAASTAVSTPARTDSSSVTSPRTPTSGSGRPSGFRSRQATRAPRSARKRAGGEADAGGAAGDEGGEAVEVAHRDMLCRQFPQVGRLVGARCVSQRRPCAPAIEYTRIGAP
jgi:hypothetical protein